MKAGTSAGAVAWAVLVSSGGAYATAVPDQQVLYKTVGDTKLNLNVFKPRGHKPEDKRAGMVFFFGGAHWP